MLQTTSSINNNGTVDAAARPVKFVRGFVGRKRMRDSLCVCVDAVKFYSMSFKQFVQF